MRKVIASTAGVFSPAGSSFIFLVFLALTVSTRAEPAAATKSPGTEDLANLSLEELMNIPVYAASKRMQTTSEAPAFVTIVTRDEIRKFGYRTLSDVLNSVPGFYVSNDRNYDYLGIRGFSRPGDYNTRILFLLNGMRLNDCVYDSANIDRTFPVDIDAIERVEVVRGPASSLYGTSAFFGVVNVITRQPSKANDAHVSLEGGSFGSSRSSASYGYLFGNGASLQLSGSLYRDSGQELYFKEFDNPPGSNGKSRRETDEEAAGDIYLSLLYKELSLQAGYSSRTKHVPTGAWDTLFNEPGSKSRDTLSFVDVKVDHSFSDVLRAMTRVAYLDYGYDGWWIYANSVPGSLRSTLVNRDVTIGQWWVGEASMTMEALERNKITVGTEYRLNARQFQRNADEGSAVANLDDDRNSDIWALYAEDEIRLHSKVILNAGLRYDRYNTFGGEASPRVALIYKPLSGTCAKLVYGSAFRAPNAYEMYYSLPQSQKGNVSLEPENIDTYELILEQQLPGRALATVSGFRYRIRNLIDQQIDPADGLIVFNNIDSATVDGIELALQGKAPGDVRWKASYAISEATDEGSDTRLSNSPKHVIKGNLSSPLFSPRLTGGLEARCTSDRQTLSGARVGSFTVVNATLISTHISRMELAVSVYNLFDREYGDPGGQEVMDVIVQNGRTFLVKATYNF